MNYKITKCICFDTTFKEMQDIMLKNKINSIEELKKIKTISENCKLCLPYIKEMIRTGKTEFEEILK